MEDWMQIKNTEYLFSSLGRVGNWKNQILTAPLTQKGYARFTRIVNKKRKSWYVHRLVAQAFISNPENKPCVNHKNGVKHDNRVENLEWCTVAENNHHAIKNGLTKKGEDCKKAKLKESQIPVIVEMRLSGLMVWKIAEIMEVSTGAVDSVLNGSTWRHIERPCHEEIKASKRYNPGISKNKLTEAEVVAIHSMKGGRTVKDIAEEYNVLPITIRNIFNGRCWSHVTGQSLDVRKKKSSCRTTSLDFTTK